MRRSLKEDKRIAAERRGESELRFAKWEVSACLDTEEREREVGLGLMNWAERQAGRGKGLERRGTPGTGRRCQVFVKQSENQRHDGVRWKAERCLERMDMNSVLSGGTGKHHKPVHDKLS